MAKDRNAIRKLLKQNDYKVTVAVAEAIVETIAQDSVYSADEKAYLQAVKENGHLTFTAGTEQKFSRMLSNLPLRFNREQMAQAKLDNLDSAIMTIVGDEGEIGVDAADQVFALIEQNGYTDSYKYTVSFLYEGDRMTEEAKTSLKKKIAARRASAAHQSWVSKKADAALAELFGGDFQGKTVDVATANAVLDILFCDGQYSDNEKETMANLYRNANWDEAAKELVMNEISSYTQGMSLDGSIVEAFKAGVIIVDNPEEDFILLLDHEITGEEAKTIVGLANIGTGLTDSQKRTVEYCMYTFNASEEAEAVFNAAMTEDAAKSAEKLAEKVEEISKAAETETPVTEEATATEITPSQTLMAAYNEYKNANGRITMHSADEFIAAIFKDHKYTKNEQATMRMLRNEGVFTAAANREILAELRRFIAKKNFA
jgi:hypothetical protein